MSWSVQQRRSRNPNQYDTTYTQLCSSHLQPINFIRNLESVIDAFLTFADDLL